MSVVIREANRDDSSAILKFIKELAKHQKAEQEVLATELTIKESLFSESSSIKALICEKNGHSIGFAVYFFNYSTWLGKHGLYLEDLYVSEIERGSGAGKALLKRLAEIAVKNNCGRMEWNVLNWNQPAIDFYEALGAKPKSDIISYQLTEKNLKSLAES